MGTNGAPIRFSCGEGASGSTHSVPSLSLQHPEDYMLGDYTAHQAVQAMRAACLKSRMDWCARDYETLLAAFLEKNLHLHHHLKEATALIIEEEKWIPPLSAVKSKLEVLHGLDNPPAKSKERTQNDDPSRTARAGIPYRAERDTADYSAWIRGKLGVGNMSARTLIEKADKKFFGRVLDPLP